MISNVLHFFSRATDNTHLVKKATRLRHDVTQAEKVGTGAAWWVAGERGEEWEGGG